MQREWNVQELHTREKRINMHSLRPGRERQMPKQPIVDGKRLLRRSNSQIAASKSIDTHSNQNVWVLLPISRNDKRVRRLRTVNPKSLFVLRYCRT